MKLEQRADRDETRNLTMPRQGVSLLNDSLYDDVLPFDYEASFFFILQFRQYL